MADVSNDLFADCPERGTVIVATVKKLVADKQTLTPAAIDAVCGYLNEWTPCEQTEIDAALAMIEHEQDSRLQSDADDNAAIASPQASVDEQRPVLSHDDYVTRLRQLNADLAAARAELIRQDHLVREARGIVANALMAWTSGGVKPSRTEAVREVIATTQMVRAQQAGFKSPHNDGTAFLRKQMQRGRRRVARGDVLGPNGIMRLPSER